MQISTKVMSTSYIWLKVCLNAVQVGVYLLKGHVKIFIGI